MKLGIQEVNQFENLFVYLLAESACPRCRRCSTLTLRCSSSTDVVVEPVVDVVAGDDVDEAVERQCSAADKIQLTTSSACSRSSQPSKSFLCLF